MTEEKPSKYAFGNCPACRGKLERIEPEAPHRRLRCSDCELGARFNEDKEYWELSHDSL